MWGCWAEAEQKEMGKVAGGGGCGTVGRGTQVGGTAGQGGFTGRGIAGERTQAQGQPAMGGVHRWGEVGEGQAGREDMGGAALTRRRRRGRRAQCHQQLRPPCLGAAYAELPVPRPGDHLKAQDEH